MLRILIVDDHHIVRKGIHQIIAEEFSDAYFEEAADADTMVKKVMDHEWDLVISDLSMPGRSGLDVLPQLKSIKPKTPVLIMSIHPEDHYAVRVIKSGASGYLSKDLAPEALVTAVKMVIEGKKFITPSVAEKLANALNNERELPAHQYLSDREFSVLKLLASGKSVSEIAENMYLSVNTISTYRTRLLVKMNLKTNADLTLYAMEHELI